ncbi:MAG: sugar ABC transporter permease [Herbinix sp.]|nr:sugar ABC transporter permease [Herbinix sp.]
MKVYKSKKIIILYLAPVIISLVIFVYYPLIRSIIDSFYSWVSYSPDRKWVGLANYIQIFSNEEIGTIFKNNILYAILSVIFQVGVAMVLAACLEELFMRQSQKYFRTILFLPSLISMTVIGLLWQALLNPNNGLVNYFIHYIGFTNVTPLWLGDQKIAIFCCIFVSQWQYVGYCMLLDLVGIQKIPRELYEAAKIDGGGSIKNFIYITLPMAKESMLVTALITVIGSFKVFTEIQIMTGGGPGRSTEVLATAMYRSAFINDEMGVASAYAIIIFGITLVLSLFQLKITHSGQV